MNILIDDPQTYLAFVSLISIVILFLGVLRLHQQIKSNRSLVLLCSFVVSILWLPTAIFIEDYLVFNYSSSDLKETLNWLLLTIDIFIPSFLFLTVSVSFLLAVRELGLSPNKPNHGTH